MRIDPGQDRQFVQLDTRAAIIELGDGSAENLALAARQHDRFRKIEHRALDRALARIRRVHRRAQANELVVVCIGGRRSTDQRERRLEHIAVRQPPHGRGCVRVGRAERGVPRHMARNERRVTGVARRTAYGEGERCPGRGMGVDGTVELRESGIPGPRQSQRAGRQPQLR